MLLMSWSGFEPPYLVNKKNNKIIIFSKQWIVTDGIAFADTRFADTRFADTRFPLRSSDDKVGIYLYNLEEPGRDLTSLQTSAPQAATLPVRPRDHCQKVVKKTYI